MKNIRYLDIFTYNELNEAFYYVDIFFFRKYYPFETISSVILLSKHAILFFHNHQV